MSSIPNPQESFACDASQVSNINDHFVPVNGLPVDVLCYIFEWHCCWKTTLRIPPNRISAVPQINLSHVCSSWRHTILNAPSFWRNVEIDMSYSGRRTTAVAIAREVLVRARDLPLSLELRLETASLKSAMHYIREEYWCRNLVAELIAPFRFYRLDVSFSSGHLQEFLELPEEKLSCIEELRLYCIDSHVFAFRDERFSPLAFKKLTNLTSFYLDGNAPLSEHSLIAHMPWHQLCYIKLDVPTPIPMCVNILQNNSVLESCDLAVSANLPLTGMDEPIHCPRLRVLGVDCHTDSIEPFLLRLRMPNLKTLSFTHPGGVKMPIGVSSLIQMHDMSKMALGRLSIGNTVENLDVGPLLAVMSSLRLLALPKTIVLTDDTMGKLGNGTLAPCLERLVINRPDLDLRQLLQMVKTRCTASKTGNARQQRPTAFKYVTLYNWGVPTDHRYYCLEPEVFEILKEIRECGVFVNLYNPR